MTEPAEPPRLADGRPAYYPTPTAYARDLGFSKQTATNWKRDGLIVLVDDPSRPGKQRVDTAASDKARNDHQNPLKRQGKVASDEPTAAKAAAGHDSSDLQLAAAPAADPYKQSAAASVAREKELKVRNAELDLKIRLGELCRTEDARAMVFKALRLMRDTMQRLAMDAGESANPDDPARAIKAIDEEVQRKLSALAVQIETLAGGSDVDPDVDEAAPSAAELEASDAG
ncbi:hypothetical protein [Hyphobacterium sp.]|uniref:hypothetical protein n=1 Tax=Hyphobacterium sp. TaxID=2004662 RepID=UPI003B51B968